MDNNLENLLQSDNFKNCNHNWEYKVINMQESNYFIETCKKCLATIGTLELFNN